ncbi:MAG: TIGR00251 family protein [Parcubacteria group bacterium GW2011_GWA2_42_18]|nr:MAG: TIGR00251 family protein [Parcubacteria group bacterium GW2011_GWA2_42_18]
MKIFVIVKTRAKKEGVKKIDETHFIVSVKEPPVDGRANTVVVRALADFLDITPSRLRIATSRANRWKIIEVS